VSPSSQKYGFGIQDLRAGLRKKAPDSGFFDPWIWDQKMDKIWIWDLHPGSATLSQHHPVLRIRNSSSESGLQ
jgi:hypothetical protein